MNREIVTTDGIVIDDGKFCRFCEFKAKDIRGRNVHEQRRHDFCDPVKFARLVNPR